MLSRFLPLISAIAVAGVVFAQGEASRGTAQATVNGKKITVDYGRPALKGRSPEDLMAQLPEDRMWRAGMNQVTTLSTETDLMVGGKKVLAGKYSVYVHAPQAGDWSLALNSALGQPLGKIWAQASANMANEPWPSFAYAKEIADKEVARAPMKKGKPTSAVELFTIDLAGSGDTAMMTVSWGDTSWSIDLKASK